MRQLWFPWWRYALYWVPFFAICSLKTQSPHGVRLPFWICKFWFFFVTWQSLKPKFVSAQRFSAKSDYLSLRYGDKTIIFKADADAAVVVAGHFFSSCGLWQCFLVTLDAIKGPKVKGNPCVYLSSQDKAVPSLRKRWITIWSICGNWKKCLRLSWMLLVRDKLLIKSKIKVATIKISAVCRSDCHRRRRCRCIYL